LPQPRPDLGEFLKVQSREQMRPTIIRYLDPGSYRTLDSNLSYGTISNGKIAYLQVLGESEFGSPQNGPYRLTAELSAAGASLSQAFKLIARAKALIIDVRVNYGGQDAVSMMLAGHLTRHVGIGFAKCARVGDGFGDAQIFRYTPQTPGFFGPTVILTSPETISAGGEFVMIAKDFTNVITVGDTTAGVYSDPLQKRLPNGWRIGISNERYVAPDGRIYEARGIAPDVRIGFNPEMMSSDGNDPGIRKAIDIIDEIWRDPDARVPISPLLPPPRTTCGPGASLPDGK
jgi:C-terminal processing protease CtpA/Prc